MPRGGRSARSETMTTGSYTRPNPWGPSGGRGAPARVPWGKGCSYAAQDFCRRLCRVSAHGGCNAASGCSNSAGRAYVVTRSWDRLAVVSGADWDNPCFNGARSSTRLEIRGGSGQLDRAQQSCRADFSPWGSAGTKHDSGRRGRWLRLRPQWLSVSSPCPWTGTLPGARLQMHGGIV